MINVTYPAVAANLAFEDEFTSFVSSPDGSAGWMTRYPYVGGGVNPRFSGA